MERGTSGEVAKGLAEGKVRELVRTFNSLLNEGYRPLADWVLVVPVEHTGRSMSLTVSAIGRVLTTGNIWAITGDAVCDASGRRG